MFLKPNWPAPNSIRAFTTQRTGGVSHAPFDQFNLAYHVNDTPLHVEQNRRILKKQLALPDEPIWIEQTHSTIVVPASPENRHSIADASFTNHINQICVVLTADCLPILLCHSAGTHVAAIHAGWRGLCHGIIEETVKKLNCDPKELLVWLGPAISAAHYEIGDEVRDQFLSAQAEAADAFTASRPHHWFADLYQLARIRLKQLGIASTAIYGGDFCSYSDSKNFFSYRRDSGKTGRMASLIWIDHLTNNSSEDNK